MISAFWQIIWHIFFKEISQSFNYRNHLLILLSRNWSSRCIFVRSSSPEVFCRKGVLRNFLKFTGKDLCQSLFFNKVAGFGPATLLKKKLWHRCLPVNFAKILRTPFFYRTPPVTASNL